MNPRFEAPPAVTAVPGWIGKRTILCRFALAVLVGGWVVSLAGIPAAARSPALPAGLVPYFSVPAVFVGLDDGRRSPLVRADGTRVTSAADWKLRRAEIRDTWFAHLGPWPPLIARPRLEVLGSVPRESFTEQRIRLEVAPGMSLEGYLLVPDGAGRKPAVFVPYYEPESSVGRGKPYRDFGLQLARRGFVALCLGSPGGDAFKPDVAGAACQPLSFLAYIASNACTALIQHPHVDPARIGVVGHSYGGKWALFAACLDERFACGVWSDPGIVFDETRISINYWEPWYLGLDPHRTRPRGLVTADNPRTGAYRELVAQGHDLHELHALMAPRPFLVSGGAEDPPRRWATLRHALEVNRLLGAEGRVGLSSRPGHDPTEASNAVIYQFFEHALGAP